MVLRVTGNPLLDNWNKRLEQLPEHTKKQLEDLDSANPKAYQFKVIKKSKVVPTDGDVFIVSPREGVYFYGRVIRAIIEHTTNDVFIDGKSVIVIFKCKTNSITMSDFVIDYDNLLIGPEIVDSSYWAKGYFHTIGNVPLSEADSMFDYGFYSIGKRKYFSEHGVELCAPPRNIGTYGIATINGIARAVEEELIIDPTLIVF